MREDNGAAVGEEGVLKGDGRVEVLPDVEIAVIEGCGDDFEEELVRLRDRRKNVVQSESVIILRGGDSDRFWHDEGLSAKASWSKRNSHCSTMEAPKAKIREDESAADGHTGT